MKSEQRIYDNDELVHKKISNLNNLKIQCKLIEQ